MEKGVFSVALDVLARRKGDIHLCGNLLDPDHRFLYTCLNRLNLMLPSLTIAVAAEMRMLFYYLSAFAEDHGLARG